MKVEINDFSAGLRLDKNESLQGLNFASEISNVDLSSGAIKAVDRLSEFYINGDNIDKILQRAGQALDLVGGEIFFFKKFNEETGKSENKIVFFDSGFVGFYIDLNVSSPRPVALGVSFTSRPKAINYKLNGEDVLIMASSTDYMVVWNGEDAPEIILDAPKILSMDLHYERLFAVSADGDGTTLKFSDDLDPTNWSESLSDAGFISFADERGKLLKVVSFNDYLYVFRERGITRVYANTAHQSSFYVNHLFVSGGRINPDTISVCGDRIVFMATDGFYVFDGAETRKFLTNLFPLIDISGQEKAVFFNGVYYLLCNVQGERVLVGVKLSDNSVSIIKFYSPQSFCEVRGSDESFLVVTTGESMYRMYKISESAVEDGLKLQSKFLSSKYDFNQIGVRKTLKRVKIRAKNPQFKVITFKVINEQGGSVSFEFNRDSIDKRLMFSGRLFQFEVSFSGKVEIQSVEFEA